MAPRSFFAGVWVAVASFLPDPWLAVVFGVMIVAVVGLSLGLAWIFETREATALCCLGLGLMVGGILGAGAGRGRR